eukprot:1635546-Amphidinium_carterae.1
MHVDQELAKVDHELDRGMTRNMDMELSAMQMARSMKGNGWEAGRVFDFSASGMNNRLSVELRGCRTA